MSCKAELRREMIAARKEGGNAENGSIIAEKIKQLPEYKRAEVVMIYMPILNEADITGLMGDNKIFLVPVTEGDEIYPCPVTGSWVDGRFNVPEPKDKKVFDKAKIDVVIVPGVAFDLKGNRMGYGKGYYDKFLKDITVFKIGVCHALQLTDEIYSEEHDIKMDMIVTERDVWRKKST
ncbi:MAG: 5-formyltetrahydrofolate cyclo-ligase [Clostridia bacterium]|nr:5-formyltetrahydrofolate cyclo-ligase [Clostridia bacterium]